MADQEDRNNKKMINRSHSASGSSCFEQESAEDRTGQHQDDPSRRHALGHDSNASRRVLMPPLQDAFWALHLSHEQATSDWQDCFCHEETDERDSLQFILDTLETVEAILDETCDQDIDTHDFLPACTTGSRMRQ